MKPPPGVPWDAGGGATYESGEALTPPHTETDFRDAQAIDFAGGFFVAGRRHRDRVAGLLRGLHLKPERDPRADQLAAAVALDMAQWWQPTVPGYLGRVSKTLICEAVTEAKGKAAADNIAALKKGDMAVHAAELLAGTGWLPAMLRAA